MLSPDPSAYKQTQLPRGRFLLPGWSVLAVEGPDSAAFLHAQTMNDVLSLQPGRWQWNGWLNAKGRLHALFGLLRTGDSDFALVVPDMPSIELGAALQRYVLRRKLRLDPAPAWRVCGEFAGAHDPVSADIAMPTADGGWSLDLGTAATTRRLHLVPGSGADPSLDADAADAADAGQQAWFAADLRHGLPRLPAAQREAWTPQMLSLQRLGAYSLSKGCYPGQEIVARTHYLGQAKRSLHLLAGEGLSAGADVRSASGALLGTLACAHPDGQLALGVLGALEPGVELRVAGLPAREEALSDGLQRPV